MGRKALRRPVVVGVAIGEGQASGSGSGAPDGDQLGDGTTAVVADEIDRVEAEGVEEGHDHLGLERPWSPGPARGQALRAVGQQVDGQAAAHIGQAVELVLPQIGVQEDAVDEEGRRALAGLQVGDVAEGSGRGLRGRCWPDARACDRTAGRSRYS